jgi:hypothetical protein
MYTYFPSVQILALMSRDTTLMRSPIPCPGLLQLATEINVPGQHNERGVIYIYTKYYKAEEFVCLNALISGTEVRFEKFFQC